MGNDDVTLSTITRQNPVLIIFGGVMPLINAVIAFLVGWPIVHWTDVQQGLIYGLVNAIIGPIFAVVAQSYVTPYDPLLDNTKQSVKLLRLGLDEVEKTKKKAA